MDELLRKALERQKQLRDELAAIDGFIRSYGEIADRRPSAPKSADLFDALPDNTGTRAQRAKAVAAAMDEAEALILRAGRPLSRSELLELLGAAGHRIEGGDKSKVLGTNLWRSKRFHNLKGAGYWPRETPIPEAFRHLKTRDSMLLKE